LKEEGGNMPGFKKLVAVMFVAVATVQFAFANDETPVSPPSTVAVSGKARFERRNTFVPLVVCEGALCPKPEPYWVLVLDDDGVNYEVDAMFARGSFNPPDSITVVGALIRPGERVEVDGRIHKLGRSYAIVYDIQHAGVISE
jgi:hypothetical protein